MASTQIKTLPCTVLTKLLLLLSVPPLRLQLHPVRLPSPALHPRPASSCSSSHAIPCPFTETDGGHGSCS